MIENSDALSVFVPVIGGLLLYAAGKTDKTLEKVAGKIAAVIAFLPVILIGSAATDVLGGRIIRNVYPWIPSLNITFGFYLDALSVTIALVIALVSFLATVYSLGYMKDEHGQTGYYSNLLVFIGGMLGVIFSSNLFQFYIFWELMLIPSYFLIVFWGTPERAVKIGFKYFIFTHVGAVCLLFGILTTYMLTGTFELTELTKKMGVIPQNVALIIFTLMLVGFMVKMALFPVHTWLPDAHAEAPTPISAMLSGVMIKCGAYAVVRISISLFYPTLNSISIYLTLLAVITMIYGGIMAIAQTDVKRLLAYSSISQMGYVFFGITMGSVLGMAGGIFHIINHAMCKALLFMIAGIIMHQTHVRDLKQLGGLAGKMPMTAISCLIGVLALAGTPPLSGFTSEWMIFAGGIRPSLALFEGQNLLTLLAVISTVITAAYYLWFVKRVFFGPIPEAMKNVKEAPATMWGPCMFLAAVAVVLGIYPTLALDLIYAAAKTVLGVP
jgi:NADH-quinone oxidoreductase subunit M